ncbi:MAG: sialidase family protein [Solirubrobacteraceae bacterium]
MPAMLGAVALTLAAPLILEPGANARGGARAEHSWRVLRLPVRRHRPFSFAEPGIAVGPRGRVVIDAATANTGAPPTFWLSRDGGRRWATGRDFDTTGASAGDADAAIGPDGYLYALNLAYNPNPPGQPSNPTVLVFRSRHGSRWLGPASFPPPHGSDQPDRPWLVVDPRHPAHVDVVNSEGGGGIVLWRSVDHAAHFAGPLAVTGGGSSQAALALSSRPLFDPTAAGRMFMLYETANATGGPELGPPGEPPYEFPLRQLWLATSTDGGMSWSNRPVLDTGRLRGALRNATLGHLLVASAIDLRGRLYAALSVRRNGGTRTAIYLIRSTTHGSAWSDPVRIPAPTRSNVMPALAVSSTGRAYLSWYGSGAADWRSGHAAWAEMFAQTRHPLARHPRFTVVQVSGRTPVHVGGIDTAGTVGSNLGANWGLRDFQSIAVGRCGQPRVVWADDHGTRATYTATPRMTCRRSGG